MNWYEYIWGKTVKDPAPGGPDFHHLLCHLIDVGVVAETLLADARARHWLRRMVDALGCEPEALRRVLPFLVGSHDLGKACPSFLGKSPLHAERLREAGAPWRPEQPRYPHDLELARSLAKLLPEWRIFEPAEQGMRRVLFWNAVSLAVTAHHGRFFAEGDLNPNTCPPEIPAFYPPADDWPGQSAWVDARRWLVDQLRRLLCPDGVPVVCRPENLSAVVMLLSGFTILCDWIGSDTDYFQASEFPDDLGAYLQHARTQAECAIAERRLLEYLEPKEEPTFSALFVAPALAGPRPVQRAVDVSGWPALPRQSLIVIEAPMGEGKTEAAWLVACRLAWQHGYQGIYVALPTVATSNQMYDRVKGYLDAMAGKRGSVVLAPVNGLAEFHPDVEREVRSRQEGPAHEEDQTVQFDTWFLPRKRALLAPYAVGTVDQALLAALNTRHVGLRLLGLAGKVVIIDEVHAYDLYMSRILDRLLAWLRELGTSVILLSATLPSERRNALLSTFANDLSAAPVGSDAPYPLVSVAERGGSVRIVPCEGSTQEKQIQIERRPDGDVHRRETAAWLLAEMRGGGRAVWICNTVNEAQEVFRELRTQADRLPPEAQPDLDLFHARFLLKDRQEIEKRVLDRYGPPEESATERSNTERPAILVATQVVEQSLNLDFDLMVSQLAPIDLLLQRLGRLHRYSARTDRGAHTQPRLVLLEPVITAAGPDFGRYRLVYSRWILLRTMLALAKRPLLTIPEEIRSLIEAVYGSADTLPDEAAALAAGLQMDWFVEARAKHQRQGASDAGEAAKRLLGEPRPNGKFHAAQNEMVEDEASQHHLAAQTRLGEPTIRAVLLEMHDALYAKARTGSILPPADAREILRHTVSLGHWPLVKWVLARRETPMGAALTPAAFKAAGALRELVLLPLANGAAAQIEEETPPYFRLDAVLGVVYDAKEDTDDESFSPGG